MNYPDIEHPSLGVLRYCDHLHWYEGQFPFRQSQLLIRFSTDEQGQVKAAIARGTDLVAQLEYYVESAKEYAVEKLLDIKNEFWSDEDEEVLTPEQFKNKMVLESIVISSDGEVSFYHNDGNLFFGHCILITMDSQNNFIDADTPG